MRRPNVSEYHLHIKLKDTSVKIWRELKVPPNLELDFLEHPLINIMDWEDAHLFYYMHNKIFYSDEVNLLEQNLRTEQLRQHDLRNGGGKLDEGAEEKQARD